MEAVDEFDVDVRLRGVPAARGDGEGGQVMKWLNIVGLFCDLLGAGVIAASVIASRAAIDRMTGSYYSGPNPDAQADRKRQSNLALIGVGLLCIGFALQIVGTWPR